MLTKMLIMSFYIHSDQINQISSFQMLPKTQVLKQGALLAPAISCVGATTAAVTGRSQQTSVTSRFKDGSVSLVTGLVRSKI